MLKRTTLVGLATLTLALSGCNSSMETSKTSKVSNKEGSEVASLKEHFADAFKIGTAISRKQILQQTGDDDLGLVLAHFNSFTPENSMKWERIHPQPETFDFEAPDALVEFAESNGLDLVGHTLVWHSQTPEWVFQDSEGNRLSRDALLSRMKNHIYTVAGRYKGRIFAWDVVNEAFNEDGTYRVSPWSEIIGEDFILHAFKFAHEAAPNAKLYYNDYNLFKPQKRAGVIRLVKAMQEKGIRIDGVGMQGHYALDYPDLSQTEDSIEAFAQLGVDVMITELDVSVLLFPDEDIQGADVSLKLDLDAKFNPFKDGLPDNVQQQLGQRYKQIFNILRKHQDKISRVTFWGVHDKQSWRNDWPMKGRTDYPLLIDRQFKVKRFVNSL